MESIDKELKKSSRRSKKVKNLEEEVEFIFSQDESDEESEVKDINDEILPKTPSRRIKVKEVETTPSTNQSVLKEMLQTPRRSCRKSIKPTQDYDDIINKSLRPCTRSAKKHLLATDEVDEEENENVENHEVESEVQPKWTPAKVGRVSQKRARKSRRTGTGKGKKRIEEQHEETDVQEVDTVEISKKDHKTEEAEENKESEVQNIKNEEEISEVDKVHVEVSKDKKLIEKEGYSSKEISNKVVEKLEHKDIKVEQNLIEEAIKKQTAIEVEMNETEENIKAEENLQTAEENNETKEKINEIEENTKAEENIEEADVVVIEETKTTEILDDEPLNLLQKDTEDAKNFEESRKDNEYTTKTQNNSPQKQIEELEDSFGSYLKSKDMNISDLGLNPLKDEEEDNEVLSQEVEQELKSTQETEDMPSLIVCDDEDEEMENLAETNTNNKLNKTLEANESVEIIEESKEDIEKITEEPMETLKMSDDEYNGETPRKRPRIVATDDEEINQTILNTPKGSAIKHKLPSTPKALKSPYLPTTFKQLAEAFRFPTPYRHRQNFKFNNETKENISRKTPNKNFANNSLISVTTMEPKEVVLRGIRKRSLSVCIDGNEQGRKQFLAGPLAKVKQDRIVSFYSPANQTTIIEDLDVLIAKSIKKQKPLAGNDKFVTTRRKRSMSFDESTMSTSLISKLPRPFVQQTAVNNKPSTSTSSTKPLGRTKLPNFAAIHEKQFNKMENLVDHVKRKQERAMNLINSATKLKNVSAQKNVSINKNSNIITAEKPKALKKIDLGIGNTQMNKSLLNNTTSTTALNRTLEQNSTKSINNLPDPRLAVNKTTKPVATISRRAPQQQPINKYLKSSQSTNIEKPRVNAKQHTKPAFNLSTSLMMIPSSSTTNLAEKANTSCMISNEDKMASRLQRHMDLFKGRVPSTRAGVASRKYEMLLKGVRSNRRFELQMQHRKNMEQ